MQHVCDEIEASLYRSKLLIEQEASHRMYFYHSSRGVTPPPSTGIAGKDPAVSVSKGSINSLKLKKYWNIFPKKKEKKLNDSSSDSLLGWSSIKDRYEPLSSSSVKSNSALKTSNKAVNTVVSPWENYSSVPEVIFEEDDNSKAGVKNLLRNESRSPERRTTVKNHKCTCNATIKAFGSVRTNTYASCSCCTAGARRYGTARPVMTSSNRKSIINKSTNPFILSKTYGECSEIDEDNDIESDAAYGSMYDSSPTSSSNYIKIGKYVKNTKNAKSESIYGTTKSRKSILECDVNPYELISYQNTKNSLPGDNEVVKECDLEDDDLNIKSDRSQRDAYMNSKNTKISSNYALRNDSEPPKGKKPKSKNNEDSNFSIYSKVEKGTVRIGGRAMAFNWQKERKMPKQTETNNQFPQKPPRRSVSVPDIRSASTKDDKFVINSKPFSESKKPSKVPSLAKLYDSLGPLSKSQSNFSTKIPPVSSVVNRKSRTPSPTRKFIPSFKSNSSIQRAKLPPPPPPAPPIRTCSNEDSNEALSSAQDSPDIYSQRLVNAAVEIWDVHDGKMGTVSENEVLNTGHVESEKDTSYSTPSDFRSALKKPSPNMHDVKRIQDDCSETSSSAYGSMNSQPEMRKEVKSILKKNCWTDYPTNETVVTNHRLNFGKKNEIKIAPKKKQVKFKSTFDNNLFIENINDTISYLDGPSRRELQDWSEEEDETDILSNECSEENDSSTKDITLDRSSNGDFVSVSECIVTNSDDIVSKVSLNSDKNSGGVKFQFRSVGEETKSTKIPTPETSIVSRNRIKFENNENSDSKNTFLNKSSVPCRPFKKCEFSKKETNKEITNTPKMKCSVRSWTSSNPVVSIPKKNLSLLQNTNDKHQINLKSPNGQKDFEAAKNSKLKDAIEFPEFDPDDNWLSSKTSGLSQQKNSRPKNVQASPTVTKAGSDYHDVMARGRNDYLPSSAKSTDDFSRGQEVTTSDELTSDHPKNETESHFTTLLLPNKPEDNERKPEKTCVRDCSKDLKSTIAASNRLAIDTNTENTIHSGDSGTSFKDSFTTTQCPIQNCDMISLKSRESTNRDSPTYDIIKSGTITCTYLTEGANFDNEAPPSCDEKSSHAVNVVQNSTVFDSEVSQVVLLNSIVEDSEIDQLYDDIAGNQEPIYEELSEAATTMNPSPKNFEKKSIFEGASKTEILSILNNAKERVMHESDGSIDTIPFSTSPVPKYMLMEDGFDETSSDPGIDFTEIPKGRSHHDRLSNLSNISDSSTTSGETSQPEDNSDDLKLSLFINPTSHRRRRGSAEIERNDSGVGSETSKPSKVRRHSSIDTFSCQNSVDDHACEDCEQPLDSNYDIVTDTYFPFVCEKCHKRRAERKEIISEIVDTEVKYGNDLKILKEEFYKPMEVAGLLMCDHLQSIFINLDELRKMNSKFVEKLTDALEIANEQGDEDYLTVSIGRLFLDSTPMLHGFETYCVQQSSASLLLNNLQKEKELLRIFLCVSQMENTLLRRMNLPAFLMVPVQRVTKYPLLLSRLYKVTPPHHKDRDALKEGQKKIELHLEHINLQTKGVGSTKIWRKISNISITHKRTPHVEEVGNIKLRTMALELLQWNREEVKFVKEGKLLYTQPSECTKKNKAYKFTSVNALLVTLGRPDTANSRLHAENTTPNPCKATLLLVKEKGNRLVLLREQLHLKNCVISTDLDSSETFEVHQITTKNYLVCKADSKNETMEWADELKKHAGYLGTWRQRRNALANIMINGLNRQ